MGASCDPGSAADKKSWQRGTIGTEEEAVEDERGAEWESEMRTRCVGGCGVVERSEMLVGA